MPIYIALARAGAKGKSKFQAVHALLNTQAPNIEAALSQFEEQLRCSDIRWENKEGQPEEAEETFSWQFIRVLPEERPHRT